MSEAMFHQSSLDTIIGRFPSPDEPVVVGSIWFEDWRGRTEAAAKAVRLVLERRADLVALGRLTEKGICEEVAKMAEHEVRPHVARLEEALSAMDAAEGRLRDGAGALAPIDQGNVETAVVRADIRRHLFSLPLGERVRLALEGDELTQQAIESAPAYLTGLPAEVREQMKQARVDRNLSPEARERLNALKRARGVVASVGTGLRAVLEKLSPPVPPSR